METKKITPQELIQKFQERVERMNKEGKNTKMFMPHAEIAKKLRERAEKAKAEGKTIKGLPLKNEELFAKFKDRLALKKNVKLEEATKVETTNIEKKEE